MFGLESLDCKSLIHSDQIDAPVEGSKGCTLRKERRKYQNGCQVKETTGGKEMKHQNKLDALERKRLLIYQMNAKLVVLLTDLFVTMLTETPIIIHRGILCFSVSVVIINGTLVKR